ncbi:tetratricopeptide repeat protein [Aquiflexum sp.]|uniref:tetratricopeptide repeat-containing sensor histidine kinase n=1 Tax=Aquiflexum sp. TaxID=1872584 RepID=UPI003593DD82
MTSTTDQIVLKQRIDELNRLAWEIRINEIEKAMTYSKEAATLSIEINYAKGQADAFRIIGFASLRKSDYGQAKTYLEEASSIYDSLNDLQGLAVVHEYDGIIYRNTGNCKAALESIYKALALSRQTNFRDNEVTNLYQLGVTYRQLGDYDRALEYLFESLLMARASTSKIMEAYNLNVIGSIYFETGDYQEALNYFHQGLPIRQQAGDYWGEAGSLDNIGHTYLKLQQYDEAISHCRKSLDIARKVGDKKGEANSLLHLAEIYQEKGELALAADCSNESMAIRKSSGDKRGEAEVLLFLAGLQHNGTDNMLEYLLKAADIAENVNTIDLLSKLRQSLYSIYKDAGKYKEALEQLELHTALEVELHKNTIAQKMANLKISHKAEEARKETEAVRIKNNELSRLNNELEEQKVRLQQALTDLKMTQAQLIQSEKMASLGELTAGIAHEFQNPLNFVNNFSEVSAELVEEIKETRAKVRSRESGSQESRLKTEEDEIEDEILEDIKQNLEKINHHGKRADSIVKGMLEHSRTSSGEKVFTDINALADEYLRLSYYGMRAKNKNFQADFRIQFDPDLPKINVVPQDIGRVLLNVINNAFQAVGTRHALSLQPMVTVSTKNLGDKIQISVKDNGPGIPDAIKDKIFQPFFTTKPTGQGTGLGLSLSYDIVKAHGGEFEIRSTVGIETEFTIHLPFAS